MGMRNLDKLIKGDHILGVKDAIFDKDRLCSACQAGKQVGGSHPMKNIMTTRRPLELLHMDLFGPNAYKSLGGNSFGLVIVDKDRLCSARQARKQVGGSHPVKNIMTTRRPLELLHMDLFGPNAYKILGGNSLI